MADHCRVFALSDPKDPDFITDCQHEHGDTCDRCELVMSVLDDIEEALLQSTVSEDDMEELSFAARQARSNILSWKAHLLRSIHRDSARTAIMERLDETSVLLIQDWAMKYLPRKYRESQTNWFGKRGIPWHISVAFRKWEGQIELHTFCHSFKTSCNQDSSAVLAIMSDVIRKLKRNMPGLSTVNYRNDNAGCYHSGPTIVCCQALGKKEGVSLRRLDFSDPQGGKGPCDRKAATIKNHMRLHLDSGNDIETAEQMFQAMTSSGGVPSLSVILCEGIKSGDAGLTGHKIDGVSLLTNIEYSTEGIRVWRAYGIGPGKLVKPKKSSMPNVDDLPVLVMAKEHQSQFSSIKRRTVTTSRPTKDHTDSTSSDDESPAVFSCPEEGCTKIFLRYSSMVRHVDCGKHKYELEHETLFDKAAKEYADQLNGQGSTCAPVVSGNQTRSDSQCSRLAMGWALKSSDVRRRRFSLSQRAYLTNKFRVGETTGRKADPASVARSMMRAKDANGNKLFSSADFLTATQIASFFSRLASKKTLDEDDSDMENIEAVEHEAGVQELLRDVINEIAPKHPIVYDTYNLCELSSKGRLGGFAVSILRDMCLHLQINVDDIKIKRRQPYVDRLQTLCGSCTCRK